MPYTFDSHIFCGLRSSAFNRLPKSQNELNIYSSSVVEDEEVLLAEDTLSNHTDLADSEPVTNEVRKQFLR